MWGEPTGCGARQYRRGLRAASGGSVDMTSIDMHRIDTHGNHGPTRGRRAARRTCGGVSRWRAAMAATAVAAALAGCSSGSDSARKLPLGTEAVVAYVEAATSTTPAV